MSRRWKTYPVYCMFIHVVRGAGEVLPLDDIYDLAGDSSLRRALATVAWRWAWVEIDESLNCVGGPCRSMAAAGCIVRPLNEAVVRGLH